MLPAKNRSTRRRILDSVVHHAQYVKAIELFEQVLEARVSDDYVQGNSVIAPSGSGKTTIAQEFLSNHRPYDGEDRTIIPVLSFSMPTACTGKGVYQAALSAMGYLHLSGTEAHLGEILINMLVACGVKVIVIDEAQHLLHIKSAQKQSQSGDCLKALMNEARVSIILMGTSRLRELMNTNEELRSRFSKKVKIQDWKPGVEEDINEVAGVVAKLLKDSMTTLEYQELLDPAFVSRIIYACGGRIGNLQKLLIHVLSLAETKGVRKIKSEHFEEAFRISVWDEADPKTNPFHKKFEFNLLNEPHQPFWRAV